MELKGFASPLAIVLLALLSLGPASAQEPEITIGALPGEGALCLTVTDRGVQWVAARALAQVGPIQVPHGGGTLEIVDEPSIRFRDGAIDLAVTLRQRLAIPLPKGKHWEPTIWKLDLEATILVDARPDDEGFFHLRLAALRLGRGLLWDKIGELLRRETDKVRLAVRTLNALFERLGRKAPLPEHLVFRPNAGDFADLAVDVDLADGVEASLAPDLGALRLDTVAPIVGTVRVEALRIGAGVAHAICCTHPREEPQP